MASNVFISMAQGESPYWQGQNQPIPAPSPWARSALVNDPTFDNCKDQGEFHSGRCHRAWGLHMSESEFVVIHGAALWTFFNAMNDSNFEDADCEHSDGICQTNMIYLNTTPVSSTFMYSLGSKSTINLVYDVTDDEVHVETQLCNPGGWGSQIGAYVRNTIQD